MIEFLNQYWPNLAGTVTGGIILSALFFLLKERLFSLPQVTGVWEVQLITEKTEYNPFNGLKLWYQVTLIQNVTTFSGIGELDRECSREGTRFYIKNGRRPVEIQGTIEKRLTKPDLIHILWSEMGSERRFSNAFTLNVSGSKTSGGLWGRYTSTAAKSTGHSSW